jgi:SAM-dependent methyltransferase
MSRGAPGINPSLWREALRELWSAGMAVRIINPFNGLSLQRAGGEWRDAEGNGFPIIAGVPRICEAHNYSESFGFQWNKFARTQFESGQSERRLFAESGWRAEELDNLDILEVGSGAGRFSRVMLERTKALLWSVDYSTAVESNFHSNNEIAPDRFHLFQASVYELPFPDESFDRVFCFGVLQHTPDFEKSVEALVRKTKPGGEIVVDFYPIRGFWTKLHAKYLLRPLTKRIPHTTLLRLVNANVDWLMNTAAFLRKARLGHLTRFLPLVDLVTLPAGLTTAQRREWAVLDTFDMFSPEHDRPQRVADVARMFERHGARVTFAGYVDVDGTHIAVVRARRELSGS